MNREHVKKSFLDWSEGKLASDKKAVVDHHLESCPECQAYFRKMAAALDKPGKTILPKLEADPFLPTRIKALAEEKQKKISLKTQKAIRWNRAIRLSFSAFLLLIAASIGVFLGRELATANTSAEMYSCLLYTSPSPRDPE